MIWWCTFAEISPSKIIARILNISLFHCVKSVRILSFSGSYFPTFAPEKLWIWTLFKQRYFTITSANPIKWSNTLKQFVGKFPTNCLSVFDHFLWLALKGWRQTYMLIICHKIYPNQHATKLQFLFSKKMLFKDQTKTLITCLLDQEG